MNKEIENLAKQLHDIAEKVIIFHQNTIERDAYKKPFSDTEIEQELLPEKRYEKVLANNWYQKGRDDEYYSFLTSY